MHTGRCTFPYMVYTHQYNLPNKEHYIVYSFGTPTTPPPPKKTSTKPHTYTSVTQLSFAHQIIDKAKPKFPIFLTPTSTAPKCHTSNSTPISFPPLPRQPNRAQSYQSLCTNNKNPKFTSRWAKFQKKTLISFNSIEFNTQNQKLKSQSQRERESRVPRSRSRINGPSGADNLLSHHLYALLCFGFCPPKFSKRVKNMNERESGVWVCYL